MRAEKSFRGISQRLARHYLTNLGGEEVDDDHVEAADWTATLSAEKVKAAGSFELTEVTVVFEGEANVVEPLVEQFTQKAMRAGG
ncbi:hypothetical protein [Halorarius litoreus]|uniref:hypothetical protein n=1 Tax=Halorarius litoreus TaxID=2962676 RepID=UPI0020CD76FE|nr:hypothetical protein [Halorarius litoreus]